MDFTIFKNRSSKLTKIPLPGESAHHKLAPVFRLQELEELHIPQIEPRHAAVMAVFYPDPRHQVHFVLILRPTYRGVHSNQVAFPGGRVEKEDLDLAHTALRETEEEVGIPQNDVMVVKEMTPIYIPPSNFWVRPYMGILDYTPELVPQQDEVESIIEVDLDDFLSDSSLTQQRLNTSYSKSIEVPAFLLNGHVVWGATAMMLNEMKDVLKEVL